MTGPGSSSCAPAPDASPPSSTRVVGETIGVGELPLTLLEPYPHADSSPTGSGNRLWRARVEGDLRALLDRHGRPIAYGYLDRRYPLDAYQSVFTTVPGSAEMASAARPFTDALVTALVARGIGVAPVTLHTGVSSQEAGEGPQPEWYHVPAYTARLVELTRTHGGRVVATGTTVTRALRVRRTRGTVRESWGWTERVVTPAHPAVVVDGLITGWHDAQASHLLLVEAIAGTRLAQAAYDEAVARGLPLARVRRLRPVPALRRTDATQQQPPLVEPVEAASAATSEGFDKLNQRVCPLPAYGMDPASPQAYCGCSPVTRKTTRRAMETAWSAMRS